MGALSCIELKKGEGDGARNVAGGALMSSHQKNKTKKLALSKLNCAFARD